MSDPPAAGPAEGGGPVSRGSAASGPRADGDEIAVDIGTRAGLVTVVFSGRGTARACPAAGAFAYRDRQYTGSVFLSGPGWHGSSGLGLSLHPAGGPAGRSVTDAIAGIVGADVAAYVRAHPDILGMAAQARAQAEQARAVRDLELLAVQITAAEQHLAGLRRKEARLRDITVNDGLAHRPGAGDIRERERMNIYVTWVTPREYTATLDDAALLSRVARTGAEHQVRQLLARLHADGTLDDPDITRLAAVIGDHPGLLTEDDEHWTSTGASEVTHIEAPARPGRRSDDRE
jgi:hypothetical protein